MPDTLKTGVIGGTSKPTDEFADRRRCVVDDGAEADCHFLSIQIRVAGRPADGGQGCTCWSCARVRWVFGVRPAQALTTSRKAYNSCMTNEFLNHGEVSEVALMINALRLVAVAVKGLSDLRRRRHARRHTVMPIGEQSPPVVSDIDSPTD